MKELRLQLPKEDRERVTRQMKRITNTDNRCINHYLRAASKRIIDLLVAEAGGTIIIGKNPLWKQEANMGRRTNQNVVSIPHARFIDMLTYKATPLVGIGVEVSEESYTSKASFVDLNPIPGYKSNNEQEYVFSGKWIGRHNRLYRTANGRKICADINGAYNILRKRRPDAFAKGVAAYVVQPIRLAVAV
jgi:putative transposase